MTDSGANAAKLKKRANKAAVIALGLAGAFYMASLVQLFITGIDDWEWFGVTIKLRPWWKPAWIGIGLWLLMLAVAQGEPRLFSWVRNVARLVIRKAGLVSKRAGFGWAVWGGFLGAALAYLFSFHFYYLFPALFFRIIIVILSLAISSVLHFLFYHLVEIVLPLLRRETPAWRLTSTRLAIYLVIWGLLATLPLSEWEALGTDPFARLIVGGLASAGFLTWLVFSSWSVKGVVGWARRAAIPIAAVAAVFASIVSWRSGEAQKNPESPPRDRILLITIDTTRSDFLSCYGYPRKTSPNLDALAASGVRFTRAFCQKGETDPSHASILTGTYPRTHGVLTNYMPVVGNVECLATVFQEHGYETISITSRSHLHPWIMNLPGFSDISAPSLAAQYTSAYNAYRRLANKLIEHRDKDLFIWLHFFDPHASYKYHPGYSEDFVRENKGSYVGEGRVEPGELIPEEEIEYARDLYAGELFYMDYWIGRSIELVRTVEPVPAREPFILVISDHGEVLGDYQDREARYAFGHGGVLYNASSHIPFMISWPGHIPSGIVVTEVVETVDVAATMLDYVLGYDKFPSQGMSLKRVIQEGAPSDNLGISYRGIKEEDKNPYFRHLQHAVMKDDYKLIFSDTQSPELYDLGRDWAEERNIASENQEIVERMSRDLKDWIEWTPKTEPEKRDLSKGELSVLRALGYIK